MKDISNLIIELRGEKVILDFDLAILYGVDTKVLKQSVKRNISRFPTDFMFKINSKEIRELRSQFVTATHKTYNRSIPWAFTELGVAMLSTVLRSEKAIAVNIMIMRIFVHIRRSLSEDKEIKWKISAIEDELTSHSDQLKILFQQLDNLTKEDLSPDDRIGFKLE